VRHKTRQVNNIQMQTLHEEEPAQSPPQAELVTPIALCHNPHTPSCSGENTYLDWMELSQQRIGRHKIEAAKDRNRVPSSTSSLDDDQSLVDAGFTSEGAINKIRQVYGNVSVTKLIDSIVADKKYPEGRHPNL
jgi:hypothetical protein